MNDIKKLHNTFSDARVLYVEDEESVRRMSLPLYEKFFGKVDTASNGEEGLELFEANGYDIIITDLRMPKMDGRAMLENISKITSDVITIILTASDPKSTATEKIADIYLSKPFGLMDFVEALKPIQEKYNIIKKR